MNASDVPEVEILGHINLLEQIHKALLFCGFLDFLTEAYGYHVRALAMVQVVSSKQGDDGSL